MQVRLLHSGEQGHRGVCSCGRLSCTGWQASARPLPSRPIYRTLHDIVTDGMKPKHGGPLWAFQFWLQAYFPELRATVNISDAEPLANAFARAPKKHNTSALCYKFFYSLAERTGDLGLLPGFALPSLRHVQGRGRGLPAKLRGATVRSDPDGPTSSSVNQLTLVLKGRCLSTARRG
ncbi:hypothetical protein Pyn_34075 [Prunus yedoensis var. nudiflora]|uniref:Aminotransferase-like plant mobile domain-containing protein n=1 Tax=Prunus yedoensis var. nudiflora TaxID=2094558 RepID=A0A314XJV2_PRUYE|nr:hypothetical protein Pyn_34075 [Prunus yedoensis var. nudiflora]